MRRKVFGHANSSGERSRSSYSLNAVINKQLNVNDLHHLHTRAGETKEPHVLYQVQRKSHHSLTEPWDCVIQFLSNQSHDFSGGYSQSSMSWSFHDLTRYSRAFPRSWVHAAYFYIQFKFKLSGPHMGPTPVGFRQVVQPLSTRKAFGGMVRRPSNIHGRPCLCRHRGDQPGVHEWRVVSSSSSLYSSKVMIPFVIDACFSSGSSYAKVLTALPAADCAVVPEPQRNRPRGSSGRSRCYGPPSSPFLGVRGSAC